MVVALTIVGVERDIDLDRIMKYLSFVTLATDNREDSLDPAQGVLLHAVGHLDQPPPGALHKRHQAIDILITGQRNLEFAAAVGYLWIRRLRFGRLLFRHFGIGLLVRLR